VDLLTKGRPGRGTEAAYRECRKLIPVLDKDRELSRDIAAMAAFVRTGEIVDAVGAAVGALG
jgi:histidine ammonia-lyase